MRSCNGCFCRSICRIEYSAVLERFSKPGSLDELEELWRKLALKCEHFLDKKEVAKYKEKNPS